jgi:hypothetical protein
MKDHQEKADHQFSKELIEMKGKVSSLEKRRAKAQRRIEEDQQTLSKVDRASYRLWSKSP